MNVTFSEAEERWFKNAGQTTVPDGEYVGTLIDGKVVVVGNENRKKLCLKYRIKHPANFEGVLYSHFFTLDVEKILWVVKKALGMIGINTATLTLSELEAAIKPQYGVQVRFSLRTDGKYQNAEVLGAFSTEPEPVATKTAGNEPPPFDDENIPF